MPTYITYLRVSTKSQGSAGLGIEAQRSAVNKFVKGTDSVVKECVEVESGKKNNRPILLAAIDECKRGGHTLLIAKLDRLSRNAAFIFTLRDTGVDFICADMPDANSLTVGIFAVIAQHEAKTISERTKVALAAKKLRGESLGNPANLTTEAKAMGLAAIKHNAATAKENVQAAHMIQMMRNQKHTLQHIANELNRLGYKTRRGSMFTPCAVQRLSA